MYPEGPIPAPQDPPSAPIPQPPGDTSAPPPILSTPPTEKSWSFQDFVIGCLFLIFSAVAIWYGWTLGQAKGRDFLLYIQSFGEWAA
jgi:hypothetical protein